MKRKLAGKLTFAVLNCFIKLYDISVRNYLLLVKFAVIKRSLFYCWVLCAIDRILQAYVFTLISYLLEFICKALRSLITA